MASASRCSLELIVLCRMALRGFDGVWVLLSLQVTGNGRASLVWTCSFGLSGVSFYVSLLTLACQSMVATI
jgi:hypothetical protein